MVQTRSQAKPRGLNLPDVHQVDRGIDPHVRLGKQTIKPTFTSTEVIAPIYELRVWQSRAGLRWKIRTATPSQQKQIIGPAEKKRPEIVTQPQTSLQTEHILLAQTVHRQPLSPKVVTRQVPPYPETYTRIPPRPPHLKENWRNLTDLDKDINTDFEENSSYQEGIILEIYQRPDNVEETPELGNLLDTTKLVQKFLLRQTDIDKMLEVIQRKVLKVTHHVRKLWYTR